MRTQRSREGYLLIDNRASGDASLESATKSCCGCNRVAILNPDRSRPRTYCRQCDSYMCDECSLALKLSGEHRPLTKVFDDLERKINRDMARGTTPILLPHR